MKHHLSLPSRRLWASALFTVFVAAFGLSGCGGQQATVTPSVVTDPEALGRGVEVSVKVVDARPSAEVGQCEPNSSFAGKLTTACDPAPAIRLAVERGLKDKGFSPAAASDAVVRKLTLELKELRYAPNQGGANLDARAVAVLAVTADNNGQTMTRQYKGETVWKLPAEGVEPNFDTLLSMTVSKAIKKLVLDYELIHFMEKTVLRTRDLK